MIDPKFFEKTLFLNGYIIFTLIPYQKANASVYQKANTLVCIGLPKGKHIGLYWFAKRQTHWFAKEQTHWFTKGQTHRFVLVCQKANASVYQKANALVYQKANTSVYQKANTLVCIGLPKGKHIGLCGLRVELILMKSRIYKSLELRMTGR